MRRHALALSVWTLLLLFPLTRVSAQETPGRTPEQIRASFDAHKGDFDYLLGDWEFTAESKQWGTFRGYWSAVRLDEGQVLDEYRVVGDDGQTAYVTTSLRNYNSALNRWELIGADAGGGLQDFGTARKVGAEMHIEQKFGVATGKPSVWKIRYYDIRPDSFSWAADVSTDGGRTWGKNHQTIQARRIGPPRSLGPLAPARRTDPISGLWLDENGVGLDLRYDGNGGVSGTVLVKGGSPETNPPIRKGTFDPKNGAFRLEGEHKRPDGTSAAYLIEGKVDGNTASGTYVIGSANGPFTLTRKR